MTVNGFNGEYRFLSNFFPCSIEFEGLVYTTVEHAYQAAKTNDEEGRNFIWMSSSASEAKRRGRMIVLRKDWDDVKLSIMKTLLRKKFYDHVLKAALLQTGRQDLSEMNYWHDQYWGSCTCLKHQMTPGQNHLGKLLMELRSELQGVNSAPVGRPVEVT